MLSRIILVAVLAGTGVTLGAWWAKDVLHRAALWALLVWLLFESIEAAQSWDCHPWRPYALTLWSSLRDRVSAVLVVPLAFVLTGIGVALIYRVVGNKTAGDLWMFIGLLAILAALIAIGLVTPSHRRRARRHGSSRRESFHG